MKKVVISFFLAAIMVIPMAGAVSLEPMDPIETNYVEVENISNVYSIPQIPNPSDDLDSNNQDSPQPRVIGRVEPVGLLLCPLVYDEENGYTPYLGSHKYFGPPAGMNFISRHIWLDDQTKMLTDALDAGKIPVGWFFQGAYDVSNIYQPIRWEYNECTALGTSELKKATAVNGRTTFTLYSLFEDEETPFYDFGIKGHILYRLAAGDKIVNMPIQLTVDFVDYNPPVS